MEAFPNSSFIGFDYHEPSIQRARAAAQSAGVAANTRFEVAKAKTFPGRDYDLIACFDCLHDMGDPKGAAAHIRKALNPDGTFMLVEPFAHDELENNLNPVGRISTPPPQPTLQRLDHPKPLSNDSTTFST